MAFQSSFAGELQAIHYTSTICFMVASVRVMFVSVFIHVDDQHVDVRVALNSHKNIAGLIS